MPATFDCQCHCAVGIHGCLDCEQQRGSLFTLFFLLYPNSPAMIFSLLSFFCYIPSLLSWFSHYTPLLPWFSHYSLFFAISHLSCHDFLIILFFAISHLSCHDFLITLFFAISHLSCHDFLITLFFAISHLSCHDFPITLFFAISHLSCHDFLITLLFCYILYFIGSGMVLSRFGGKLSMAWGICHTCKSTCGLVAQLAECLNGIAKCHRGGKGTWPDQDSNPGPLAYCASILPLSYRATCRHDMWQYFLLTVTYVLL